MARGRFLPALLMLGVAAALLSLAQPAEGAPTGPGCTVIEIANNPSNVSGSTNGGGVTLSGDTTHPGSGGGHSSGSKGSGKGTGKAPKHGNSPAGPNWGLC